MTERTVEVVVWRAGGDALVRPPALARTPIRLDDANAVGSIIDSISAAVGAAVALVRLTDDTVHVEALEPLPGTPRWREPDVEVGGTHPWNRFGWYVDTCEVINSELASLAVRPSGPIRQHKHWSISAVLSVETDDGVFWYKQVPPFMAHEGRLITALAQSRPEIVPDVVAVGDDWSLMRAFPTQSDRAELENPFGVLAELQQAAASRLGELLALGCPDRRSPQLLRDLEDLCHRDDLLDAPHQDALGRALPDLRARLDRLNAGDIQDTIVHGDLHAGNWSRRGAGDDWIIFDWTDGCVAHPFMDLGTLPADEALRARRIETYLASWRGLVSEPETTLATALPVAAGFHAVSYQRIVDNLDSPNAAQWKPVVGSFIDRLHQWS